MCTVHTDRTHVYVVGSSFSGSAEGSFLVSAEGSFSGSAEGSLSYWISSSTYRIAYLIPLFWSLLKQLIVGIIGILYITFNNVARILSAHECHDFYVMYKTLFLWCIWNLDSFGAFGLNYNHIANALTTDKKRPSLPDSAHPFISEHTDLAAFKMSGKA